MKRFVRKMPKRLVSILVVLGIVLSTLTVLTILPAGAAGSGAVAGTVEDKTGAYAQWENMSDKTANLILRVHDDSATSGGGEESTTPTESPSEEQPTTSGNIDFSSTGISSFVSTVFDSHNTTAEVDTAYGDGGALAVYNNVSNSWESSTNPASEYAIIAINTDGLSKLTFDVGAVVSAGNDWMDGNNGLYRAHYGVMIGDTIYWDSGSYGTISVSSGAYTPQTVEINSSSQVYQVTSTSFNGGDQKTLSDIGGISAIDAIVIKPYYDVGANNYKVYIDNISAPADTTATTSYSANTPAPSYESVSVQDVAPIEANYNSVMAGNGDELLVDWETYELGKTLWSSGGYDTITTNATGYYFKDTHLDNNQQLAKTGKNPFSVVDSTQYTGITFNITVGSTTTTDSIVVKLNSNDTGVTVPLTVDNSETVQIPFTDFGNITLNSFELYAKSDAYGEKLEITMGDVYLYTGDSGGSGGSGGSGTTTPKTFTATLTNSFNFDTGRSLTENIGNTMFDEPGVTADSESITDSITFGSGNKVKINDKTVTWTVANPAKYNELIVPIKLTGETKTQLDVTTTANYNGTSYDPQLLYSNIQLDKKAEWTGGPTGYTSGKAQITLTAYDETKVTSTEEVDVTLIVDRSDSMSSSTGYMRANQAAQRVLANERTAFDTAFDAAKKQTDLWRTVPLNGEPVYNNGTKYSTSAGSWGMCLNESHRYLYDMANLTESLRSKILAYVNSVGVKNATAVPVNSGIVLNQIQGTGDDRIINVDGNKLTVLTTSDDNVTDSWTNSNGNYSYTNGPAFIILEVNSFMKWCVESGNTLTENEIKLGLQQYANMHLDYKDGVYTCISEFADVMYANGATITNTDGSHMEVMRTTDYSNGCTDYSINTKEGLKAVVEKISRLSPKSNVAYLEFGNKVDDKFYNISEYNGQYDFYPYYGYNNEKGITNSEYYNLSNENQALLDKFYTYKDGSGNYTPYKIDTGDRTFYAQGLKDATDLIKSNNDKKEKQLILFVSDGAPNDGGNNNTYQANVQKLIQEASDGGTKNVYFYTVGIGLLDVPDGNVTPADRSYYLNQLKDYAAQTKITGGTGTVTAVSASSYIDVTDSTEFAEAVTSAINEVVPNAGTYVDYLSKYFAFPTTPTGTLKTTVKDGSPITETFTGTSFTSKSTGQTIEIDPSQKKITWDIPNTNVKSTLTFDVVVDTKGYASVNDVYKSLGSESGSGQIPTNKEAYFNLGLSTAQVPSPKLNYTVEKAAPSLSKTVQWAKNYMTTGLADITLGVHDPDVVTTSSTSTAADVTIILDRSDSMTATYTYLSAVKTAKKNQTPGDDGQATKPSVDVLDAGGYDACANENHLYVYKGTQITNGWSKDKTASINTLKSKIVAYANECAKQSSPQPSEIGCLPLKDIGTVSAYFGDLDNRLSVDIQDNNSFIINNLKSGTFTSGWTIENGKYTEFNENGWFVLNIHKFIDYCASPNGVEALTAEELTILREASLIHVKPDNNKFTLLSRYEKLETSAGHYYSEEEENMYLYSLDYDDGCSDRLTNAQEGLASVVDIVLGNNENNKLGYVEFKGDYAATNNSEYYTKDTKDKAMTDIYTYREKYTGGGATDDNPLTPYDAWTNAGGFGTSYAQAIEGLKKMAQKNNTSTNKQIILFISDGVPNDGGNLETYQNSLNNALSAFSSAPSIEFNTIGLNLTNSELKILQGLATYVQSNDSNDKTTGKFTNVGSPEEFKTVVEDLVATSINKPVTYTDILSSEFDFPTDGSTEFEIVHYTADTADALEKIVKGETVTGTNTKIYKSVEDAKKGGIVVDGKTIKWTLSNPQKYHKLVFKAKLKDTSLLNSGKTDLATNNYAYYDRTPNDDTDGIADTVWTTKEGSPKGATKTFPEPGPLATPKVTKDISLNDTAGEYEAKTKLDLSSKNGKFYIILYAKDPNYDSSADVYFKDTLSNDVEVNDTLPLPDGVTVDTTGKVISWELNKGQLNNGATVAIPVKLTDVYMKNADRLDALAYFNSNDSATLTSTYRDVPYEWKDTDAEKDWLDLSNPQVAYQVSKVGLTVTKKDTTGNALSGAKFKLYEGTNVSVAEIGEETTDVNGVATFTGLTAGQQYTLVETQAPDGYELYGKVITFKAGSSYSVDSIHGSNVTLSYVNSDLSKLHFDVEVKNTLKAYNLPQSGGPGAIIIVCLGVALMIGAAVYFVYSRRSK